MDTSKFANGDGQINADKGVEISPEADKTDNSTMTEESLSRDRRASTDEWDASKVPPSRFQRRKGSIFATPGSRDGHVERNYASEFHEKHAKKGYGKEQQERKSSRG